MKCLWPNKLLLACCCMLAAVGWAADSDAKQTVLGAGIQQDEQASMRQVIDRRYSQADLVALVTLNYREQILDERLMLPGALALDGYLYQGELKKLWKGDSSRLLRGVQVQQNLELCARSLPLGQEYILFGKRLAVDGDQHHRLRLQLASCDDVVAVDAAQPWIQLLNGWPSMPAVDE